MAKTKRFMDGGQVSPNQYPFANNPNNIQVGSQQEPLDTSLDFTQQYAKGGKVKKYADGGDVLETPADVADRKKREAMERSYNRSLRSEGMEPPTKQKRSPLDLSEAFSRKPDEVTYGSPESTAGRKAIDELTRKYVKKKPDAANEPRTNPMGDTYKKGGRAKCYAKGGMIDGIAQRGKTKCKIC